MKEREIKKPPYWVSTSEKDMLERDALYQRINETNRNSRNCRSKEQYEIPHECHKDKVDETERKIVEIIDNLHISNKRVTKIMISSTVESKLGRDWKIILKADSIYTKRIKDGIYERNLDSQNTTSMRQVNKP